MNLEGTLLNEISQRKKNTVSSHLYGNSQKQTNIKQKQTQIGRKKWVVVIVEGRDVGKIGEGDTEVQTSSCKVNKP